MARLLRLIILILLPFAILLAATGWLFRFEAAYLIYRPELDPAADRYGIPRCLLAALAWRESRFQPLRRGQAGEIGLLQILPTTAQEWAATEKADRFCSADLLNPATNAMAGAWYLSRALTRWRNAPEPVAHALAEYNAGPSNVLRWHRLSQSKGLRFTDCISYPGTRRYVKVILLHYDTFGRPWKRWGDVAGQSRPPLRIQCSKPPR